MVNKEGIMMTMAECKDCFHFKVCAYADHYLPVCDSFVADVATVVRCKDCSHCSIEGSLYLCALWNHLTELDDFCSDGKEVRNNERVDQR